MSRAGPFNPSFVVAYKNRMVYGAVDKVYISEPFNSQWISADQHVQFLPGLQTIFGAFADALSNLNLVSQEGTFSLADSGGVPANWAGPALVDGGVGTTAQAALNFSPKANTAWVAGTTGLRGLTNGVYADPPLNFWVPDWGRINWAAAATIELIDDLKEQTIRVLVPLNTVDANGNVTAIATAPTHEMTFDYKSGNDPATIRYSLNTAPGRFCMALVLNATTQTPEVWMGPAATDVVWRKDKALTDDNGAQIAGQIYETNRILDVEEMGGPMAWHGGALHRTGYGALR